MTSDPPPDEPERRPPRIRPYLDVPLPTDGYLTDDPDEPEPVAGSGGGDPDDPEQPALRPFVLTAGRTQSADPRISLETQVTTHFGPPWPQPPPGGLGPELTAIVTLCQQPLSVAEISARLRLHFGVTRVLVGDLREAGFVDVHHQDTLNPHSPELIMRVISGLRALS
jgi:hypothetical protein